MSRIRQIEDNTLVLKRQEGDDRAFARLVDRWRRPLWVHIRCLVDSDEAAWDGLQESWMAAVKGLRRLDEPRVFPNWLFRIATNKCRAWVRKRTRRRAFTRLFRAESERVKTGFNNGATHAADDLLRSLPTDQRDLLSLRYVSGFTVLEIAHILDVPPGTVKSRLCHARQRAKALMEETTMLDDTDANLRRLLESEPPSRERDELVRENVSTMFRRKRATILFRATVYLAICLAGLLYGARMLGVATDTKAMLVGLSIGLAAFEGTILIKLWYWIVDNRVVLTRELKLAQFMAWRGNADSAALPELHYESLMGDRRTWKDLRMRLVLALFYAILALFLVGWAFLVMPHFSSLMAGSVSPERSYEQHATLSVDGRCEVWSRTRFVHKSSAPLTELGDTVQGRSDIAFYDRDGNPLPFDERQAPEGRQRVTVRFPKPFLAGDMVEFSRRCVDASALASLDDGTWRYQSQWTWGNDLHSRETVKSPPGATLLSNEPPTRRVHDATDKGRMDRVVLVFEARQPAGHERPVAVTYSLGLDAIPDS